MAGHIYKESPDKIEKVLKKKKKCVTAVKTFAYDKTILGLPNYNWWVGCRSNDLKSFSKTSLFLNLFFSIWLRMDKMQE